MAYPNQKTSRVSTDRFGRPYQLKFAGQVYDKKNSRFLDDIYKCRVELGGKEYDIEVSPANKTKETRQGDTRRGKWVKVTKVEAQKRQTSM